MDFRILSDKETRCQTCGVPVLKIFTWDIQLPMTVMIDTQPTTVQEKLKVCAQCLPALRNRGFEPEGPKGRILPFTKKEILPGKTVLMESWGFEQLKAGPIGFKYAQVKVGGVWLFEKIEKDQYRMTAVRKEVK